MEKLSNNLMDFLKNQHFVPEKEMTNLQGRLDSRWNGGDVAID